MYNVYRWVGGICIYLYRYFNQDYEVTIVTVTVQIGVPDLLSVSLISIYYSPPRAQLIDQEI